MWRLCRHSGRGRRFPSRQQDHRRSNGRKELDDNPSDRRTVQREEAMSKNGKKPFGGSSRREVLRGAGAVGVAGAINMPFVWRAGAQGSPIKIGVLAPLSGPFS